ncbi:3-oxoacyl-ACP synthase III family protein [Persicitalea jodogahamensis]|uniref:3-oxoacyl-[acyl-carrier-protein] synthase 3 n=1 Tax=Persicitalea jodogahamensis TaxID=402147 RepID=A0A8J3D430_9BACT|nr:ketoacyl-ACP synthase III [Persicitalea jodogahamensis]GHB56095.1 3-oxoacyl-[acyl-carrier-protein] synthase 3 [Persicitalea jodogahamensis]
MYINRISHYLPTNVVDNEYFTELNNLSSEWIVERTGIRERRKAGEGENTNTMAIAAVEALLQEIPYSKNQIDLIVGATYTPYDTIVSLAHAVQHHLNIPDIPVVSVSSACSSLLNAIELAEGYFAMNKASCALVIVADHNTAYNNENDTMSGHLWGDGASAMLISKERQTEGDLFIRKIITGGAATSGKAVEAVVLRPNERGVVMPYGRDVFQNACTYMPKVSQQVLEACGLGIKDIDYLIPHQANHRISLNVINTMGIPEEKLLSNIQRLGNTGCVGCAIALSENKDRFKKGDRLVVTVFGGGYSYGAMLIEV